MNRITDIFSSKERTLSFEFFTPKTEPGVVRLTTTIEGIFASLRPDFLSVTYGAGGSTRTGTTALVEQLQQDRKLPVMHHLTCIGNSRDELALLLADLAAREITNILALGGDPPAGDTAWAPHPQGFRYASELVALARGQFGDIFTIGAAGFPERHPRSTGWEDEIANLKIKMDNGTDFLVTQLFFDPEVYFSYVRRVREAGITARIIPGVLPITDYEGLIRFTANCGASVPEEVHRIFKPVAADTEKTFALGVDYAVRQCRSLLAGGAPGIHFYTANRHEAVARIVPQRDL
jgi:methylenetetrahydrofolate reductase (NADPH)